MYDLDHVREAEDEHRHSTDSTLQPYVTAWHSESSTFVLSIMGLIALNVKELMWLHYGTSIISFEQACMLLIPHGKRAIDLNAKLHMHGFSGVTHVDECLLSAIFFENEFYTPNNMYHYKFMIILNIVILCSIYVCLNYYMIK